MEHNIISINYIPAEPESSGLLSVSAAILGIALIVMTFLI